MFRELYKHQIGDGFNIIWKLYILAAAIYT